MSSPLPRPDMRYLRPEDRIAIAAFDEWAMRDGYAGALKLLDWRGSLAAPLEGFSLFRGREDSMINKDLYSAMQWAMDELKGRPGRKGLLLFTDGEDFRLLPQRFARGIDATPPDVRPRVIDPLYGLTDLAEAQAFETLLTVVRQHDIPIHIVATEITGLTAPGGHLSGACRPQ